MRKNSSYLLRLEWLEKDLTLTTSSHRSNSSSVKSSMTCLNMSVEEVDEVLQSSSLTLSIIDNKLRRERRRKSTELGLQCFSI